MFVLICVFILICVRASKDCYTNLPPHAVCLRICLLCSSDCYTNLAPHAVCLCICLLYSPDCYTNLPPHAKCLRICLLMVQTRAYLCTHLRVMPTWHLLNVFVSVCVCVCVHVCVCARVRVCLRLSVRMYTCVCIGLLCVKGVYLSLFASKSDTILAPHHCIFLWQVLHIPYLTVLIPVPKIQKY